MASGVEIANEVSKYFKKGRSDNSAAANDGAGDSDMAAKHQAATDELSGQICPDCHAAVQGTSAMFGQPANEASGAELTRDQVEQANLNRKPAVNPLTAIRDPNGIHGL